MDKASLTTLVCSQIRNKPEPKYTTKTLILDSCMFSIMFLYTSMAKSVVEESDEVLNGFATKSVIQPMYMVGDSHLYTYLNLFVCLNRTLAVVEATTESKIMVLSSYSSRTGSWTEPRHSARSCLGSRTRP